jgi:hypothetical protein
MPTHVIPSFLEKKTIGETWRFGEDGGKREMKRLNRGGK